LVQDPGQLISKAVTPKAREGKGKGVDCDLARAAPFLVMVRNVGAYRQRRDRGNEK
jgi:hypothetical protein